MKIGHTALITSDIEKSASFYALLGGKKGPEDILVKEDGTKEHLLHMVFDGDSTLELVGLDPAVSVEGNGHFEHICFEVENVDETVAMLRENGVDTFTESEPVTHDILGGIRIIFLTGPDNELIELYQNL